jgi:hypothetical protein
VALIVGRALRVIPASALHDKAAGAGRMPLRGRSHYFQNISLGNSLLQEIFRHLE